MESRATYEKQRGIVIISKCVLQTFLEFWYMYIVKSIQILKFNSSSMFVYLNLKNRRQMMQINHFLYCVSMQTLGMKYDNT